MMQDVETAYQVMRAVSASSQEDNDDSQCVPLLISQTLKVKTKVQTKQHRLTRTFYCDAITQSSNHCRDRCNDPSDALSIPAYQQVFCVERYNYSDVKPAAMHSVCLCVSVCPILNYKQMPLSRHVFQHQVPSCDLQLHVEVCLKRMFPTKCVCRFPDNQLPTYFSVFCLEPGLPPTLATRSRTAQI